MTAATDHPLAIELAKVQYDLTSLKARVSEIQRQVAALNLAPTVPRVCEDCGLDLVGVFKLAEHRYLQHEGPVPAHWQRSEEIAAPDAVEDETELVGIVANQDRSEET